MPNCRQTFRSASFALQLTSSLVAKDLATVYGMHRMRTEWLAITCCRVLLTLAERDSLLVQGSPPKVCQLTLAAKNTGNRSGLAKSENEQESKTEFQSTWQNFTLYQGMQMCLTRHCKQNFCVCVCVVCECV